MKLEELLNVVTLDAQVRVLPEGEDPVTGCVQWLLDCDYLSEDDMAGEVLLIEQGVCEDGVKRIMVDVLPRKRKKSERMKLEQVLATLWGNTVVELNVEGYDTSLTATAGTMIEALGADVLAAEVQRMHLLQGSLNTAPTLRVEARKE